MCSVFGCYLGPAWENFGFLWHIQAGITLYIDWLPSFRTSSKGLSQTNHSHDLHQSSGGTRSCCSSPREADRILACPKRHVLVHNPEVDSGLTDILSFQCLDPRHSDYLSASNWPRRTFSERHSVDTCRPIRLAVPKTGLPCCFTFAGFDDLAVEMEVLREQGLYDSVFLTLLKARKSTFCKFHHPYWKSYFTFWEVLS